MIMKNELKDALALLRKIKFSKDYKKFEFLDINRLTDIGHIQKMINSGSFDEKTWTKKVDDKASIEIEETYMNSFHFKSLKFFLIFLISVLNIFFF